VPTDERSARSAEREVLGREPERSRGGLVAAGILVVVLAAFAATHLMPTRHQPRHPHPSQTFNMFTRLETACDKDGGDLVTTDAQGTPTAFATADGPARYWCVSRDYLASIGRARQDAPPPIRQVPSQYKWLWPRTTYGQ
jgi:hypothetical protein